MTTTLDSPELRQVTDCPVCHESGTFRPKGVMGQFWFKRCTKCGYYKHWPLPKIEKKIIYLDQFVLSNMLSGKDARWAPVYQGLKLLTHLQVVTCPYSEIHEDESLLAEFSRDDLKAMYRDLSGGDEFLTSQEIEQNQLLDAIRRYLNRIKEPFLWTKPRPYREFCKNDPHRWTGDMMVYAEFPLDPDRIVRLQGRKDQLHSGLQGVAENWKDEDRRYEEDVKREALSYGRSLLEMYRELADAPIQIEAMLPDDLKEVYRASRASIGSDRFNPRIPVGMQPGVLLVHWLAAKVHNTRPHDPDPVAVVEQFFQSPEAMEAPFQYISSRLWATIAQKVRNLKGARQPKASDNYDVKAVSTYAPYCDAMVVDNEFCAMASQKNIDVPGRYGVRLFSARTHSEFIDYLDDLLTNIPNDHRLAVKQVRPHLTALSWLKTD